MLVLIDVSGMIYKAYYGLPPFKRASDGLEIGCLMGVMNQAWYLLQKLQNPSHVAAIFDTNRPTFRHELYRHYKANRPPRPQPLTAQIPLVREGFELLGVPTVDVPRYEADDVIGSYAKEASREGSPVLIATVDKDASQLVDDLICLWNRELITRERVEADWGVSVDKIVHIQALAGDVVDNVPGVPGIGMKRATALVQRYGDIEKVFADGAKHETGKLQLKLQTQQNLELARLSLRLVTLNTEVEGCPPIAWLERRNVDWRALVNFLNEYQMLALAGVVAEYCGVGSL